MNVDPVEVKLPNIQINTINKFSQMEFRFEIIS
jgi:hypothetical protein